MTEQHSTPRPTIGTADQWRAARLALLDREKQLTRLRDELAEQRRQLPWVPWTSRMRSTARTAG